MTGEESSSINVDFSPAGKSRKRAITSGEQAYSVAKKLEGDQRPRNSLEAIVDKKYNGDLPYKQSQLVASEEAWRNNFSTGFMSGIIGKVVPAPVAMIDSQRFLTASRLCNDYEEAEKKAEYLRGEVTTAIRQWAQWKNFQYGLWAEVVLHGNAIVAAINPYSPWPEMYRTDRAFVPMGTGQHASNVPIIALSKDYMVHEFVEFIQDKSIAEEAGWDTEAAIKAVNDSLPRPKINEQPRSYEDAIREGNQGASYSGGKFIQVYHILAVEPDTQKVTHYIVNKNGNHEVLFQKDDRFEKMSDAICLFTLEPGNGTFYGSKGLGRLLLNMHIACEANRCLLFDQLRLAGMNIFKTEATKFATMRIRVRHPFLVLSGDGEIQQQPIAPNVDAFVQADNQLSRWAEQLAGSYISDLHGREEGPHPTATEEQFRAQREQQFKIAFLSRAYGQHSDLIAVMQRRLFDPETMDEEAKKLQKRVKKYGIETKELNEWKESAVAEVAQDLSAFRNQSLIQAYATFKGDADFDQHKLKDLVATAMVSPQFTQDTLLDEQGLQVNEIESYQKQVGENEDMINGASVPVSPRDMHAVHLKVGLQEIQNGIMHLAQNPNPKAMDSVNLMLRHAEDGHIALWEQAGAKTEELKPFKDAVNLFEKALVKIAEAAQKGAQQAPPPDGQPPPEMMVPAAAAPNGQMVPDEEHLKKIASTINYSDAPPSIRRQIEAAAGFSPSSDEEDSAWQTKDAIEKHPDLPGKTMAIAPPPPAEPALPVSPPENSNEKFYVPVS